MICESCGGTGFITIDYVEHPGERRGDIIPCRECIGGIASCCDGAGSGDWIKEHNRAVEARQALGAKLIAEAAYRNERWPERLCDHCQKPYRGPAVYCSLECALADA